MRKGVKKESKKETKGEKKREPKGGEQEERKFVLQGIPADVEKEYAFDSFFNKKDDKNISKLRSQLEGLQISSLKASPDDVINDKTLMKMNLYLCGVSGNPTNIKMNDKDSKELPKKTKFCCRNDGEVFHTRPIGAPIKFNPSIIEIVTKDSSGSDMIMCRTISASERKKHEDSGKFNVYYMKNGEKKLVKKSKNKTCNAKLIVKEYFDTLYNFCSTACALRFSHTNRHLTMFKYTVALMRMMVKQSIKMAADEWQEELQNGKKLKDEKYMEKHDKKCEDEKIDVFRVELGAAPPVDMLEKNGGTLSIEDYRNMRMEHPNVVITCQQQIMRNGKVRGNIRPVGLVYEQYESNKELFA